MAELPLLLCSALYFAAWCHARETDHWSSGLSLALALALGCTLRETFFVLLPSALWVLARRPGAARVRDLTVFAVAFAAFLGLVFWPMYRNLAPYPHFLSALLDRARPDEIAFGFLENVRRNLAPVPLARRDSAASTFTLQYLLALALPLLAFRASLTHRAIAVYAAFSFAATFMLLVAVYPLRSWAAVRAFFFTLPPGLLLLADFLVRLPRPATRRLAVGLTVATFVGIAAAAHRTLVTDRAATHRNDDGFSRLIADQTGTLHPRVVIAEKAFLYGWYAYPVIVIWRALATPQEIAALEKVVAVDVIVARRTTRDALIEAAREGTIRDYRLWSEPTEDIFFLVSPETIRAARPDRGTR